MLGYICPKHLPYAVDDPLQAVVFADAYVRQGETLDKAGHIPHDMQIPAEARHDNG